MNPRTFLQRFEESAERDALVYTVHDAMRRFATDEGLTIDDISTQEMEQLAEAFVERGLGVPASSETARQNTAWTTDDHGLQHTLGFTRQAGPDGSNVYRFAVERDDGWHYIDCEPGLKVKYLQNKL